MTIIGKTEIVHNDTTIDGGRRKAIKKIAVGVGVLAGFSLLPEKWTTPIIGQIVLPAHAQTSGAVNGNFLGSAPFVTSVDRKGQLGESIAKIGTSIADFIVADAHAIINFSDVCVNLLGDIATLTLNRAYQGIGSVSGGVTLTAYGDTFSAVISILPNDSVGVDISRGSLHWVGTLTRSSSSCVLGTT